MSDATHPGKPMRSPGSNRLLGGAEEILAAVAAALRSERSRPAVTLTYAQSLDGCISAVPGESTRISNEQTRLLTHHLRAVHDAILVGVGTVLADDPQLNVRLIEARSPRPIVLDSRLRIPSTARLLSEGGPGLIIATSREASAEREAQLVQAGAQVLRLPVAPNGWVDIRALMDELAKLNIGSVMVEGGSKVITNMLTERIPHQLVLTIAPRILGGLHAVDFLNLSGLTKTDVRLENPRWYPVQGDIIVHGDFRWAR